MSLYPKPVPHRSSRRQPRGHNSPALLGEVGPGSVRAPQIGRRGLNLEDIVSANYVNGFINAQTNDFTVPHTSNGWNRPGGWGNDQDLRVRVGYLASPLLCDFSGQLGWRNNHATDKFQGRVCAVLYTGNWSNAGFYARSDATASNYQPNDNNFYTIPLLTSFIIPGSDDVTDSRTGAAADWYIGFQVQLVNPTGSVGDKANQNINRQSITCRFFAAPALSNDDNSQSDFTWDIPSPRTVPDTGLS